MPKIFISYRRTDSSAFSLKLFNYLAEEFGEENIFRDKDTIRVENFVAAVERAIILSDIVLVIIGQNWLNASNQAGRRLDNPDDFVRREIEMAFRQKLTILPILLNNTLMPSSNELPPSLYYLPYINAINIYESSSDVYFKSEMEKLVKIIRYELDETNPDLGDGAKLQRTTRQIENRRITQPAARQEPTPSPQKPPSKLRIYAFILPLLIIAAMLVYISVQAVSENDTPTRTPTSNSGGQIPSPTDTPTTISNTEIAFNPTFTPTHAPTNTSTPSFTPTFTLTSEPSTDVIVFESSQTPPLADTPVLTATPTMSPTSTFTLTWTPTPTPTSSITPVPISTTPSTIVATATVIAWSPSPSMILFDNNYQSWSIQMVYAPAGCLDANACVEDFWIDAYEVTNAQYRLCFDADMNPCDLPNNVFFPDLQQNFSAVFNTNWFNAREYCERRHGHLPTKTEMLYVAQHVGYSLDPNGSTLWSWVDTNEAEVDNPTDVTGATLMQIVRFANNTLEQAIVPAEYISGSYNIGFRCTADSPTQ